MNKNIMVALAFSLLAMFVGMTTIFIVKTALVHASVLIAVFFGIVGAAAFLAIVACAFVTHQEGSRGKI